jgi:hypothetical protein
MEGGRRHSIWRMASLWIVNLVLCEISNDLLEMELISKFSILRSRDLIPQNALTMISEDDTSSQPLLSMYNDLSRLSAVDVSNATMNRKQA